MTRSGENAWSDRLRRGRAASIVGKRLATLAIACLGASPARAEVTYDPVVAAMIGEVSQGPLEQVVNELSGETAVALHAPCRCPLHVT